MYAGCHSCTSHPGGDLTSVDCLLGFNAPRSGMTHLDVKTHTTSCSSRVSSSRRRIIASAISITWNSSRHSTCASSARSRATGRSGSPAPAALAACIRLWTSSMNAWKCTRRLWVMHRGSVL